VADKTSIEWTRGDDGTPGATWSPVTGCTKVSDGCLHCYIDKTPPFRINHRKFNGDHIGATTGVQLHPERLGVPLGWRKPRRIFVCSLADLFQDEVPDAFIADVFATMALAPHHTFQVLTKRHARLKALLNKPTFPTMVVYRMYKRHSYGAPPTWPLPNVWIGVSVENQQWADIRIPALLETTAAVRWLSCEPLIGPVLLGRWLTWADGSIRYSEPEAGIAGISWVVGGGESGPGARPMHPDWARSLRDECRSSGVPWFFKQFGQHAPVVDQPADGDLWVPADGSGAVPWKPWDGHVRAGGGDFRSPGGRSVLMRRHRSKHDAGRLLDGREWSECPGREN
jgi:protein gp37